MELSTLFLYWTTRVMVGGDLPHNDAGTTTANTIEALNTYGLCKETSWPYFPPNFMKKPSESAFEEAKKFPQLSLKSVKTFEDMKEALKNNLPVILDVFFPPESYGPAIEKTGMIPPPNPENIAQFCDHSVVLVGFDDEKRLMTFVNSWGEHWGDKGCGYIPYDYFQSSGEPYYVDAFTVNK
jgi:C1A family cysteine protease